MTEEAILTRVISTNLKGSILFGSSLSPGTRVVRAREG